jgi:N6-L-threonylcarbamoyladenine synthase
LAFQDAAVDTLVIKCTRAMETSGRARLVVAGGVGANQVLRERLSMMADEQGYRVYYPRPEFCTDNAAMIAYAGWIRLRRAQHNDQDFSVRPRWSLTELSPVD